MQVKQPCPACTEPTAQMGLPHEQRSPCLAAATTDRNASVKFHGIVTGVGFEMKLDVIRHGDGCDPRLWLRVASGT